jgi:hypothetical protein
MRIGVYVDAFNLYYGGRSQCGKSQPGWRWLDVRQFVDGTRKTYLAKAKAEGWAGHAIWDAGSISRVVYCTAPISPLPSQSAHNDQDAYIRGLLASGSVDHVEKGYYQQKVKVAPMAVKNGKLPPTIVTSGWPIQVQDSNRGTVPNAAFLVSYLHTEEKGSDVNVGTHLLMDMYSGSIDAAIVVSNDSDLRLPVEVARKTIPVGIINPAKGYVAGALRHGEDISTTQHWHWTVSASHYTGNQLQTAIGTITRPQGW